MSNSSLWPIGRTLSSAIILGQSGPGSDGNEGTLSIPPNPGITGASPSYYLVSYPGHSLRVSYPSAEMQSVYSVAPDDWAIGHSLEGVLPFCRSAVVYSIVPTNWAYSLFRDRKYLKFENKSAII